MVAETMTYLGKYIQVIRYEDNITPYVFCSGVVLKVGRDDWGKLYLRGSWGNNPVYPDTDEIKFINKGV